MKTCNAKAKGLKGDEFKKVRDECLKAQPTAATEGEAKKLTPQDPEIDQAIRFVNRAQK